MCISVYIIYKYTYVYVLQIWVYSAKQNVEHGFVVFQDCIIFVIYLSIYMYIYTYVYDIYIHIYIYTQVPATHS